jgi:endonuclease YncB( thermonuclease family)
MSGTAPTPQYVYRARLKRVVDGDTAVLTRDCGAHIYQDVTIRILGINAPELHGPTATAGQAAQQAAVVWFAEAELPSAPWPLIIATELDSTEKYGRLLARVWRLTDGAELSAAMIAGGFAVSWDGKGARPV